MPMESFLFNVLSNLGILFFFPCHFFVGRMPNTGIQSFTCKEMTF